MATAPASADSIQDLIQGALWELEALIPRHVGDLTDDNEALLEVFAYLEAALPEAVRLEDTDYARNEYASALDEIEKIATGADADDPEMLEILDRINDARRWTE